MPDVGESVPSPAAHNVRPATLLSDHALEDEITQLNFLQDRVRYDWHRYARPSQMEPNDYRIWAILAGRGYGKTRTGSETVRAWASANPGGHYAVLAKSNREVLNICFEAPRAGLVAVFPPEEISTFQRGFGMITLRLANGSIIRGFSSEAPDALRGYAFDGVWLDEFGAWHPATAQACYDMLWFCMREAGSPRMIITTTPRNCPHLRRVITRAEDDTSVVITRGSTLENAANLSPAAIAELENRYGGTRLGRQELDGELLTDIDGAMWQYTWIDGARVDAVPVELIRTVVAVDPAGTATSTSDETGIIVAAAGADGHDYVLADSSARTAGAAAAALVWRTFIAYGADEVVIEGTNAWMLDVLQETYNEIADGQYLSPGPAPVVTVGTFNRSKFVRAEPVAARYEQGRIHHVGHFPVLEEQLCSWLPGGRDSPDRMDALVHAVSRLRDRFGYAVTITYPPRKGRSIPQPAGMLVQPRSGHIVPRSMLTASAFNDPQPVLGRRR